MCEMRSRCLHRRPTAWLTVSLLLVFQSAGAQSKADRALHSVGPDAESVCVLAPVHDDNAVRHVPNSRRNAKSLGTTSTFAVTYINEDVSDPWPDAGRAAFSHAAHIWETTIVSSRDIRVNAYWAERGGCSSGPVVLGSAGARALHRDHPALPLSDTWYVDALADALTGLDMGGSTEPDIRVFLNRDCDNPEASSRWYFGTDGDPPSGHIDFVSVVLHEIAHGLGISGAGRVTSGAGTVRYSTRPYVYDRFTVDGSMRSSPLLTYPDFSPELGNALQSGSGGVLYDGGRATTANGGEPPSLFAPDPWLAGSSYSHLDEQTYNNTSSALMTPMLSTMEANHVVGPVTCGLLEDIGWTVSAAGCDVSLPVELAVFSAMADGETVILQWQTLSEQDNVGFEIQHQSDERDFETLTFVSGAGHSSSAVYYEKILSNVEPGVHRYRLRQLDADGRSTYSDVVAVEVALATPFELTAAYPNPFRGATTFGLMVAEAQSVRVDVLDMLGRSVATLFDGFVHEGDRQELSFDAEGLPAGVYLYRAVGERFAATRTAVVLR